MDTSNTYRVRCPFGQLLPWTMLALTLSLNLAKPALSNDLKFSSARLSPTPSFGGAFAVVPGKPIFKAAGNFDNPAVMPVQSSPFGASYAVWSARFWQWEFSLPVTAHPLFETADCSAGQAGHVWFLGGTFLTFSPSPGVVLGQADRTCVVPPGTALFFPVVNNECSTIPGDQLPGFTTPPITPEKLQACAKFASSFIVASSLKATLDGVPINGLTQYDVTSPLFSFGPLPPDNLFGVPAGTTGSSVSDGIHLMLHPLSVGEHTLYFHAEEDLSPIGLPDFIQDITYHLIVTP